MLKEIEANEFDTLTSDGVVLVDFFSTTCGPCKMLSFVLNDVDKELGDQINILKIDFDKNKDLTEKYEVKGYPTMIIMKNGEEVKRMQGLQQKPAIIKALQAVL